jgi:hypothetical protein
MALAIGCPFHFEWFIPLRVLRHNSHHATAMAAPTTAMARDAMTAPRCHTCRRRSHPLRFRPLFDCWYCPRCETVRIRVIVNQLITELTS